MNKLTPTQEITSCQWGHPDEARRAHGQKLDFWTIRTLRPTLRSIGSPFGPDLEIGNRAEKLIVQERPLRAAGAHDEADREAGDHASQMGASGRMSMTVRPLGRNLLS
jgi:hypothetical protein